MKNSKIQKMSTKGQIVIPVEIREALNIKEDSQIIIELDMNTHSINIKLAKDSILGLRGAWRGKKTAQEIKDDIRKEELKYEKRKFKTTPAR